MEQPFITDSGERLNLCLQGQHRLGAGGQGQVFRSTLAGGPVAVKLLREVDAARLEALRQLAPTCAAYATLPLAVLHHWRSGARAEPAGYVMPCIDPDTSLSAARLFNFDELQRLQRFTWRDAVLAGLLLAESVAALHAQSVVVGDLNPENVVFTPAAGPARWRAVLLDSDSFQIRGADGRQFHCGVARPLYTAPELVGCDLSRTWRDVSSDHFALAILIYQLLLHDHPFDNVINPAEPDLPISEKIRRGLYPHAAAVPTGLKASPARPAPQEVSATLAEAFQRSFASDPPRRPGAAEWVLLLRQLHRQVVPCRHTPHHHHPRDQACPWCAVEQRIGHSICRFPNTAPSPQATAIPANTSEHWAELKPALRSAFECHHQRALALLASREAIAQQLLDGQSELATLLNCHGGSGHWVDQAKLQQRLNSWRRRLIDLFGNGDVATARRNAFDRLIRLADTNSDLVHQRYRQLQKQRKNLQGQLAALELSALLELTTSSDPAIVAESRLSEAASQIRERWLRDQLNRESLRSWSIEGFGEARLRLLESHGLCHGDQLRTHIDRLQALPGIGAGLQQRLRSHLNQVLQRLEAQAGVVGIGPERDDLLPLPELLALQNGEQQLQQLTPSVKAFTAAIAALAATIQDRRKEAKVLLEAFEELC
jgi:DNA-binding helix-hairpin-helix protein with protein kinase domain